ncbi:MAG: DoxX family protein [Bacteroidia bacterium]|nr:DoxX family protein [Bacteroidia bacterium]
MNLFQKLGKWLFILPYAVFGLLHFGPLEFSLDYVPAWLPFPAFWVYFIGLCLLGFTLSAVLKRFDGLAAILLAALLLLFVAVIHIPKAASGDFLGVIATARDIAMAGAAMLYAQHVAKDKSFVSHLISQS